MISPSAKLIVLKMRYDDKYDASKTVDLDAKSVDRLYTQNNN